MIWLLFELPEADVLLLLLFFYLFFAHWYFIPRGLEISKV